MKVSLVFRLGRGGEDTDTEIKSHTNIHWLYQRLFIGISTSGNEHITARLTWIWRDFFVGCIFQWCWFVGQSIYSKYSILKKMVQSSFICLNNLHEILYGISLENAGEFPPCSSSTNRQYWQRITTNHLGVFRAMAPQYCQILSIFSF